MPRLRDASEESGGELRASENDLNFGRAGAALVDLEHEDNKQW